MEFRYVNRQKFYMGNQVKTSLLLITNSSSSTLSNCYYVSPEIRKTNVPQVRKFFNVDFTIDNLSNC